MTWVDRYLDDDLSGDERDDLARLLADDPDQCQNFIAELTLVRRLQVQEPSSEAAIIALASSTHQSALDRPQSSRTTTRRRSRRSRRNQTTPWIAIAAVALLTITTGWMLTQQQRQQQTQQTPTPTEHTDAVATLDRPDVWTIERHGQTIVADALQAGDVLRNHSDQPAGLSLPAGDRIIVHPHGHLRLGAADGTLRVNHGRVDVTAVTRASHPLRCQTPHLTIGVLGTRFTIDCTPQHSRVHLTEGRIALTHAGTRRELAAPARFDSRFVDATIIRQWTFDDGPTESVRRGKVVTDTAGGHLAGQAHQSGSQDLVGIDIADAGHAPLWHYEPNTFIHLRYRLTKAASYVQVQCFCSARRDNFHYRVKDPTVGTWIDLQIPMHKLIANDPANAGARLAPGDAVNLLQVYGPSDQDGVLRVDDIMVVRP